MKQTICIIIIFVSLFLMAGIVGGVENGEPISNLWWCLPFCASSGISVYLIQ